MLSLVITSHILEANKQLLQDKSNWNGFECFISRWGRKMECHLDLIDFI